MLIYLLKLHFIEELFYNTHLSTNVSLSGDLMSTHAFECRVQLSS